MDCLGLLGTVGAVRDCWEPLGTVGGLLGAVRGR